jgi:hypothetical protein
VVYNAPILLSNFALGQPLLTTLILQLIVVPECIHLAMTWSLKFKEDLFWLQLPYVLSCLTEQLHDKSLQYKIPIKVSPKQSTSDALHIRKSMENVASLKGTKHEKSKFSTLGLQYCSYSTLQWSYGGSDVIAYKYPREDIMA